MKTGLFVIQNNFNEILILYSYIPYIHQQENELIAAPFEGLFLKSRLAFYVTRFLEFSLSTSLPHLL